MNGTAILKNDPMTGAIRAERKMLRRKHALHNQEVRSPVAEADRESQAKHNAGPVNAHGVIGKVAHAAPHMGVVSAA